MTTNLPNDSWGFYGRDSEIGDLTEMMSSGRWFFCTVDGRRRIGKTTLVRKAMERSDASHFYFQVPDSDERGVVETFQEAAEDYGVPAPTARVIRTFSQMADMLAHLCNEGFIVVIDEFQYFHRDRLSAFTSHLQRHVDQLRDSRSGGLIVLGSIHTEMTAILEDRRSPLFNRATHKLRVPHWDFQTLFEMFDAHGIASPQQQLFLWSLFEGVPKFYRDCFEQRCLTPMENHRMETLRRLFFEGPSPLKDEAANWFLREVGGAYESVLRLVAKHGPCPVGTLRGEYARAGTGDDKKLSAYLATLIDRYEMVDKLQPIFAKQGARKARYGIRDNFLAAWLVAIGRSVSGARVQPLSGPLARASERLAVREGVAFERMVRSLLEESSRRGVGDFALTEWVQGYWNKADGSDIEIDVVALNGDDRIVRFGSCKRSASRHDAEALQAFDTHVERFLQTKVGQRLDGWSIEKAVYAPEFGLLDRRRLEAAGYLCADLADFRRVLPASGQQAGMFL